MGLCGRVFQITPGLCASGHIDIGLYYDLWSLSPLFNSINRNKTRFFLDGYLLWKFSFSCFCLIFSFVFDLFILKCLSTFFFGFIWIMIVMSAISLMKLVEYLWVWKKNLILWIGIRKYVKCTLWLMSKTRHYWGQEGRWYRCINYKYWYVRLELCSKICLETVLSAVMGTFLSAVTLFTCICKWSIL